MRRSRKDDPGQVTFFPMWEVTTVGPSLYKVEPGKPSVEMRPAAAARTIGVSPRTIYYWIDIGKIHHDEYRRPGGGRIIWLTAAAVARLRDTKPV